MATNVDVQQLKSGEVNLGVRPILVDYLRKTQPLRIISRPRSWPFSSTAASSSVLTRAPLLALTLSVHPFTASFHHLDRAPRRTV